MERLSMTAQKKSPVDTAVEWIKFANENFQVAKSTVEHEVPAYHTICFLCHESAEKFLKAYLISNNWELKKTHDLVELLEYCSDYDKEADLLFEDCSILNDYVIDGRYPADISFEEIGAKEAKEAIEKAERIKAFALNEF